MIRYRVCVLLPMLLPFAVIPMARGQRPVVVEDLPGRLARTVAVLLERPVSIDVTGGSLEQALTAIAKSAHVMVNYRAQLVDAYSHLVTLHLTNVPLRVALERVCAGTFLRVTVNGDNQLVVLDGRTQDLMAATGSIVGRVLEAKTRQPIRGALVRLDTATRGVTTGDDGAFRFPSVSAGVHRVVVRLIGYGYQVQAVTAMDDQVVSADIMLSPSTNVLDQVVVTGTVAPTELKAVPNAVTVITAKDIEQRGITKIDQLFRGDVPGLFALNPGSNPSTMLDEVTMFSRGATALSSVSAGTNTDARTNPIKTYVDGVEMADPRYLSQLDPKSIERIEILTGPQASTIYGSNAINGVMQIFTKRGTSSTPQLTLNLQSGWVENNFSSARTPQHDYGAQLSGLEGRLSYNAGGSWNYMGAWTPAKQTARLDGLGGMRYEIPVTRGHVTADVTLRRSLTQSKQRGAVDQVQTAYRQAGWYSYSIFQPTGLSAPFTRTLVGQTLGLTLGYTPVSFWTNEVGLGQDAEDTEQRQTAKGYKSTSDTTLFLQQTHTNRQSFHYTATVQAPVTSLAQLSVTTGADAWQNLSSSLIASPQTLTGSLTNVSSISRQPGHNAGGFVQTQLGLKDQLFFTYGLRAEWNPNYGTEAQPNYAPRYGVAYTHDIGAVTAKFRVSYGRSTRPPGPNLTAAQSATQIGATTAVISDYGNYTFRFANLDLLPEHQGGGEGGLELYWGTRGSLVVTRYNQVINNLISSVIVDSVRSFFPNPASGSQSGVLDLNGYGYKYQYQYLNIGNIRNQGWELQGSMNVGPLTTKGTYSWTKSRTIGVDSRYRAFFTPSGFPEYQPGATFNFFPEHTWATSVTYAYSSTTVELHVVGMGPFKTSSFRNAFDLQHLISSIRLPQNRWIMTDAGYIYFNNGYPLADLSAMHTFSPRVEAIMSVQNLANRYTNDISATYATLGRQVKAGVRAHL